MKTITDKQYLKELTEKVARFLAGLDILMKEPSSCERGKKIARLCNYLDMANDSAMLNMGYGWKKINNIKKRARGK